MMPAVAAPRQEIKLLEDLAADYFEVARCWNDHARAIRKRMSVEKAIKILRMVRDQSLVQKNGRSLSAKANELLQDIIYKQDDGDVKEVQ